MRYFEALVKGGPVPPEIELLALLDAPGAEQTLAEHEKLHGKRDTQEMLKGVWRKLNEDRDR